MQTKTVAGSLACSAAISALVLIVFPFQAGAEEKQRASILREPVAPLREVLLAEHVWWHHDWPNWTIAGPTLYPEIATDNQRVLVFDSLSTLASDQRVLITGYKYNDSAPTESRPAGEGKERIFCGCRRLASVTVPDPDGVPVTNYYFLVPGDAPSGEYEIRISAPSGSCPSGGIRQPAACQPEDGRKSILYVTPAHIVSKLSQVQVNKDLDDDEDLPAEIAFEFFGVSGVPYAGASGGAVLGRFQGAYPGGSKGAGHLTNVGGGTIVTPNVPLYVGPEHKMTASEWREECVSLRTPGETNCLNDLDYHLDHEHFNDTLDVVFGGVEFDKSPSKWWGYLGGFLAGNAATGLNCLINPTPACVAAGISPESIDKRKKLAEWINSQLHNDDDRLGTAALSFTSPWAVGGAPPRMTLQEPSGEQGNIDFFVMNERLGAPRILRYAVRLDSVTVVEGYERFGCDSPNEMFVNARAFIFDDSADHTLPATTRFEIRDLDEGETENFGGQPRIVAERNFNPEDAPASPILYVELGFWEEDDENDLMGIHSVTFRLADFLSTQALGSDEVTPEGYFSRRVKTVIHGSGHGYQGSDDHCSSSPWATAGDPHRKQGAVDFVYSIEVVWLKSLVPRDVW